MRRHLLASALIAISSSGTALAQSSGASDPTSTLDMVIVTGTRVSDRTVVESQAPIDIITPETLTATGTVDLATALARALPSLNFPVIPGLIGSSAAVRPAQLRGLSPDQVLVLVNGKRRHLASALHVNYIVGRGSAAVDLNTIPVSAIERVEVLRDGAAAQYGSDAIAGVINVVLKGRSDGGHIDATGGQYSAGDGTQWQLGADTGLALGQRGFLHLSTEIGHQHHSNRGRPYSGPPSPTQPEPGQKAIIIGIPDLETTTVAANTRLALTDTIDVYGFATVNHREVGGAAFFRAPTDPTRNIPAIYPDGFIPGIRTLSKDRSLVVGVKGSRGDWNWDASYNYGFNRVEHYSRNSLNASLGPSSPTSCISPWMPIRSRSMTGLSFLPT